MVDAGARRFVPATDLGSGYMREFRILRDTSIHLTGYLHSPLPSHHPAPLPTSSCSPRTSPPFHLPSFSQIKVQHVLRLQP